MPLLALAQTAHALEHQLSNHLRVRRIQARPSNELNLETRFGREGKTHSSREAERGIDSGMSKASQLKRPVEGSNLHAAREGKVAMLR